MKRGSVFLIALAVGSYGCASGLLIEKAQIEEGKGVGLVQGNVGINTLTYGADEQRSYTAYSVELGGRYEYGFGKAIAGGAELPLGYTYFSESPDSTSGILFNGFQAFPRLYAKLIYGSNNARVGFKVSLGMSLSYMQNTVRDAYNDTTLTVWNWNTYPNYFVSFFGGFGSPERVTIGLSAPPLYFWGALHITDRLSFLLGIVGFAYKDLYYSQSFIALRFGVGWFF
ncbi:MAG: hypothetical protein GXO39_00850 [Thermotogae bacterium]|nr:hypothetical protein [Thermotogota bacterium]